MFSLINVFIGFSVIPVASLTRLTCEKAPSGVMCGPSAVSGRPCRVGPLHAMGGSATGGNYRGSQQVVQKRLNPVERKEKPMEYLTDLVTTVPEGTSPVKVDELRAAEAVRAAELAKAGHLVRLWRPPLGPDEWRSIGLFRPESRLESSPRYPFISG